MKTLIDEFLTDKTPVIVGVSRDKMKWGHMLFTTLIKKGYKPVPVNQNASEIEGEKCYTSVSAINGKTENVIISVPGKKTDSILKDCVKAGVKRVWMHQGGGSGAYSKVGHQFCKDNNIKVIYGFCPMMFYAKGGMHSIHFFFKKLFKKFPKEYIES